MLTTGVASAQNACEALKGYVAPDVKITAAANVATPVPLCKIDGVIDKEINFSVWLPDQWNGKFVMGGQGGFAGKVESQPLAVMNALQQGYATAGTDTGHDSPGRGIDGAWAMGDVERIVNYAHGAIHRVTATSKSIVNARYGKAPERSYFAGCSNGGRQALMSAQRYPNDFDGIVAGAPAIDFLGITGVFSSVTQKMYPDPKKIDAPVLDKTAREFLAKSVLDKCDMLDGLKDGMMTDPRQCKFDVKTIQCKAGQKTSCLTAAQVGAVEAILNPTAKGKPFHVGYPYGGEGGEGGWATWLVGSKDRVAPGQPSLAYGFSIEFMRYFLEQDPTWNHSRTNLVELPKKMTVLQATLSPNNPDLSAFRSHGGKLLMYHGWSDAALSPLMSIRYLDSVYAKDATAKDDVRLFMLPAVGHCVGGPGPDRVDYLGALDAWVTSKKPPEELTASFGGGGSRKICAYPKAAAYGGAGDGKSPDQFQCK